MHSTMSRQQIVIKNEEILTTVQVSYFFFFLQFKNGVREAGTGENRDAATLCDGEY